VGDPRPGQMVVRLLAQDQRGSAIATFGDQKQTGPEGSNCWRFTTGNGQGGSKCIDTVADIQAPTEFVSIPAATPLVIVGDAGKSEGVVAKVVQETGQIRLEVVQTLDLSGGHAIIDVPAGSYTLEIVGTWDQGAVPFYFGIRVT
jgi:hypothetical protein